ncbi:ArnT family glycosyltransferase [Undibacterium sp. SXout11W]|uniref:ArnT family glycosyltransferase n=1 Tax=Undibacterium sp. SXout11W TaxID=3413050 RepID=UPI003BF3F5CC
MEFFVWFRSFFASLLQAAPGNSYQGTHPVSNIKMLASFEASRRIVASFDWKWFALLVLISMYLFPGLIGHDPWKQDETYIFGIIHHMLETGDWIVPTMAGEPFMEKPPLYYWLATILAKTFSPWMPLHDGARLATGVFMSVTCIATGWAASKWWGRGYGRYAVLSLLGCLGLVLHSHMMLTDVPLLTGFAIATAGFVDVDENPRRSGALLGTGVGVGFMAKGVLALGVFGLSAILLPVLFRQWRTSAYWQVLKRAVVFSAPWLLIWPISLYCRSPVLFMDWFWLNNVGRFFGFSVAQLGAPHTEGFWITTLPWFAFPAMPLAMITIWRHRSSLFTSAAIQACALVFSIMLLVLWRAASARDNYALPLLLPIALIAAPAARNLASSVDKFWDWSARMIFGFVIGFIWLVWALMTINGSPPEWMFLLRVLPREFVPHFEFWHVVVAFCLTVMAIIGLGSLSRIQGRGLVSWVTGLGLSWMLMSQLLMPWVDHAKSYRSVFSSMQTALPGNFDCMASKDLGESERAMLRYFAGITTYRQENIPDTSCDFLLINGFQKQQPEHMHDKNWELVWEGARPGDNNERLWLFAAKKMNGQLAFSSARRPLR